MKDNERLAVDFMGGSLVISAPGQFENKQNQEIVKYGAKVDFSRIVDKNGKMHPKTFLTMMSTVMANKEAMEALNSLVDSS